jgi:hypothetical protein
MSASGGSHRDRQAIQRGGDLQDPVGKAGELQSVYRKVAKLVGLTADGMRGAVIQKQLGRQ